MLNSSISLSRLRIEIPHPCVDLPVLNGGITFWIGVATVPADFTVTIVRNVEEHSVHLGLPEEPLNLVGPVLGVDLMHWAPASWGSGQYDDRCYHTSDTYSQVHLIHEVFSVHDVHVPTAAELKAEAESLDGVDQILEFNSKVDRDVVDVGHFFPAIFRHQPEQYG